MGRGTGIGIRRARKSGPVKHRNRVINNKLGNGDGNRNTRRPQFISFSNNRSSHAEQFTTKRFLIMSYKFIDQDLDK